MALKVIMLRHKLQRKQEERSAIPDRSEEFKTREAELETAIAEVKTDEEETVVTGQVAAFEEERDAHNAQIDKLDGEIADLEKQIREEEAKGVKPPKTDDPAPTTTTPNAERKDDSVMPNTRGRYFGMTRSQFHEFVKRDNVKNWIQQVRELGQRRSSVSGGEVLIPREVLELLRENVPLYSKLYKYVYARRLSGEGRQSVQGAIPEAVWTEMTGALNKLDIFFGVVEVDGYTVGGYCVVANSLLKDSDIALGRELISVLMKAVAKGVDKAICYGTGTKMPLGIVPRLLQTSKPDNFSQYVPWSNVSATNVVKISGKTGVGLFQALLAAAGKISDDYGNGELFWVMNRATKMKLKIEALSFNAAGAVVSGLDNTMPVIGGAIETLSFIPDNVILGGAGDVYLLAEREGATVDLSEHAFFIQNMTAFRGMARYDGTPIFGESFVAISIDGSEISGTAVTFAEDKANASTGA